MLFPYPEHRDEFLAMARNIKESKDQLRSARRMIEIQPDFALAWIALAMHTDDPAEAEAAYWKALWFAPCRYDNYLALSDALLARNQQDLAKRIHSLGFWKISFENEVPEAVAKFYESSKLDSNELETYEMLAIAAETKLGEQPEPEEITTRLLPYRLLNDLQRESPDVVQEHTLNRIVHNATECEPLLRNALREWARIPDALDPETLCMIIAILGEISGADFVPELLELAPLGDRKIFLHTHWALMRQEERHPREVLEQYRTAVPQASIGARCVIANHLLLMVPLPGDVDLLQSLIQDHSLLKKEPDAAYLIACVVAALLKRGERDRAKAAAKLRSVVRKNRDIIDDAVSEEGFHTVLESEDLHEPNIEDVCLGRILMEDEEDDEEEDEFEDEFEDEEEFEPQPPPRPGRNDPCWCGSGKKYKKCHLAADEEAAHSDAKQAKAEPRQSPRQELLLQVFQFATSSFSKKDSRRVREMYFGSSADAEASPENVDSLVQWIIHDFRDSATGRTPIDNFLRSRGGQLNADERELLESLRDARFGIFEIERIEPGRGIQLRDLYVGDSIFVEDITSSRSAHRWDCIMIRIQSYKGRWELAGNGEAVPRNILPALQEIVERESRKERHSPAEHVRANSHRWHRVLMKIYEEHLAGLKVVNREGEEVAFGHAEYQVKDQAALLAKLSSIEELSEGKPDQGAPAERWWTYLQKMGDEVRPMGHVEISGGTLRAEAPSRTRLQTLRGLLEFHAGELLRHTSDSFTTVDNIKQGILTGDRPPSPEPPPPTREMQEVAARAIAEHYQTWPDIPLPALQGKTPRDAVRTGSGRKTVVSLIRDIENLEQRKARQGEIPYDCNRLRRNLGLPEE